MVVVESTVLLQKDVNVFVNMWVFGRVMEMHMIASIWMIHIAAKILVAKKEDVAKVTVQVIREHPSSDLYYKLQSYQSNSMC